MAFRHILLATDFSDCSAGATDMAIDLAHASGGLITLLHVHPIPASGGAEGVSLAGGSNECAAADTLACALTDLRRRWPWSESLLTCGSAWQQILLVAEARHADLVVMGTHGRRGLPRALLGSVAEVVVRRSPVPVLTVSRSREQRAAA